MGGAEWSLFELLGGIRKLAPDWRLHLIAGEEGPLVERVARLGVEIDLAPFPPELARYGDAGGGPISAGVNSLRYARRLRALLRSIRPRVLHTNGVKAHLLAAISTQAGTGVVWHVRDYLGARRAASRLIRLAASTCHAAIAVSDSVARDLRSATGLGAAVHTVWNGVDMERFQPDGARLDLDAACGMEAPAGPVVRVGLVAAFARWKGHEVFLDALARLDPGSGVRGYIVGGPIYRTAGSQFDLDDLKRKAVALGLGGRTGFTGHVADPAAAIRALDIVVHASTQPEPFGRVIAEAMACSKPVVASNAGGAAEIVRAGEDALCHEPGDAAGLADRIAELAASAGLRARLGAAGREKAIRRFDRMATARNVLSVYEKVFS